jgi:hypothetical protein
LSEGHAISKGYDFHGRDAAAPSFMPISFWLIAICNCVKMKSSQIGKKAFHVHAEIFGDGVGGAG